MAPARRRAASLLVASLVLLAACGPAHAQPCIECKDCTTNNCWRVCKNECPRLSPFPLFPIRPSDITVNGDACRRRGSAAGYTAGQGACDTAKLYCQGGRPMPAGASARMGAIGPVQLNQCSNIAAGECQRVANNPGWSQPCRWELQNGYSQCSASQFKSFYEGETKDRCTDAAESITFVTPGTDTWAFEGPGAGSAGGPRRASADGAAPNGAGAAPGVTGAAGPAQRQQAWAPAGGRVPVAPRPSPAIGAGAAGAAALQAKEGAQLPGGAPGGRRLLRV